MPTMHAGLIKGSSRADRSVSSVTKGGYTSYNARYAKRSPFMQYQAYIAGQSKLPLERYSASVPLFTIASSKIGSRHAGSVKAGALARSDPHSDILSLTALRNFQHYHSSVGLTLHSSFGMIKFDLANLDMSVAVVAGQHARHCQYRVNMQDHAEWADRDDTLFWSHQEDVLSTIPFHDTWHLHYWCWRHTACVNHVPRVLMASEEPVAQRSELDVRFLICNHTCYTARQRKPSVLSLVTHLQFCLGA